MTSAQQQALHDALQLSTLCSTPFAAVPTPPRSSPAAEALAAAGRGAASGGRRALYVDAAKGSDRNAGTLSQPMLTIGQY